MNENEINQEQVTEQVMDQPAQQPSVEVTGSQPAEKTFTQDEVNAIVSKAKARTRERTQRETEQKYDSLIRTLQAGTGKQTVEELDTAFREHYTKSGIKLPGATEHTARESQILGRAEAQEFIDGGMEDVVEETERLAKLGYEKMTAREKARFQTLAEYRQQAERSRELQKIGVTEEELRTPEFTAFAKKFSPQTPVTEVYGIYSQLHPKQAPQAIGSMKNGARPESKTYYSPEDFDKLSAKDLDDPVVMRNVRESMTKWK